MIACPVTAQVERYLTALGNAEAEQEAVSQRADELMAEGGAFDSFERANFMEAMEEADFAELAKHFRAFREGTAGELIATHVTAFWRDRAEREVRRQMQFEAKCAAEEAAERAMAD